MYIRKLISCLTLVLIPFFISSCGGGGGGGSSAPSGSQLSALNGTVEVQIPGKPAVAATPGHPGVAAVPAINKPLAGVTVKVGGKTAKTNNKGVFSIKGVSPRKTASVKISHEEYWPVEKQVSLSSATTTTIGVILTPVTKPGYFDSKSGTVYKTGNTIITLPANAYVVAGTGKPYAGEVGIISRFYSVVDGDADYFPNSFKIVGSDNAPKILQTRGAQNILLYGNKGQSLKLAPNATAIVEMPSVGKALKPNQKMKMWHYNKNSGIWQFVDNVVAKNGLYRGVISQVGMLSLGIASPKTGKVTGCVNNPNKEPQQHSLVEILSEDGWISSDMDTDEFGNFNIIAVAGSPFFIRSSKNGVGNGLNGTFVVKAGETLELPKCIILESPSAKFSVKWGQKPRDLDAHLTFTRAVNAKPDKDGNVPAPVTNDVFYNTKFLDDVFLSAESSNGIGPETIDVSRLTDGEYIFSVHHYNGLSDISKSGAVATLAISGQGTRTLTPPKGAKGVNDVWTVWNIKVKSGAVTVTNINTIGKKTVRKGTGSIDISVKDIVR